MRSQIDLSENSRAVPLTSGLLAPVCSQVPLLELLSQQLQGELQFARYEESLAKLRLVVAPRRREPRDVGRPGGGALGTWGVFWGSDPFFRENRLEAPPFKHGAASIVGGLNCFFVGTAWRLGGRILHLIFGPVFS